MRVVVIEDNPGDARLIKEMLKASGGSYELAIAPDLTQGLHLLAAQPADVVLLDLGLPESCGLETLGRLQSRASELPIVITTSIDDMGLAVQAMTQGAEDYLVKGKIDPVLLTRTLAYSIERKRMKVDLDRYRNHLEDLVRERTAELAELNNALAQEIAVRKQAEKGLRALSRRLFQAQEDERRAISRELHDEIGQMLTGLLYRLESAKHAEPAEAARIIPEAQEVARGLLTQLRNLSHNLRPSMLDELGLLPSLSAHCKQFSQLTGIAVDFANERVPEDLPPEISTAAYRIIQEALTNVARHAGATQVKTRIWADGDRLHILVQDQGKGFDPASAAGSSGLSGMRERAALLDGLLTIDSFPGRGTRITAELPLRQAPAP